MATITDISDYAQHRPACPPATPVPSTWDAYFRAYAGLSLADLEALLAGETAR